MAVLDIILGGLLIYGCIKGLWHGFFAELASLVSLFVGIFIAMRFSDAVASILGGYLPWEPRSIRITAFLLLFIVVILAITILARVLTAVVSFGGLGLFNKIGGALVGLLKMVLILSIMLHLFARLNSSTEIASKESLDSSLFYNPIRNISAFIFPYAENWLTLLKES